MSIHTLVHVHVHMYTAQNMLHERCVGSTCVDNCRSSTISLVQMALCFGSDRERIGGGVEIVGDTSARRVPFQRSRIECWWALSEY